MGDPSKGPSETPRYNSVVMFGGFQGSLNSTPHGAEKRENSRTDVRLIAVIFQVCVTQNKDWLYRVFFSLDFQSFFLLTLQFFSLWIFRVIIPLNFQFERNKVNIIENMIVLTIYFWLCAKLDFV